MPLPQRKLHRLQTWDYSDPGYYYITICTNNKKKLLSRIQQNGLEAHSVPTPIGKYVLDCWNKIPQIYPHVKLDYFCLMPNHLHGIVILEEKTTSLSEIIRAFKSVTTRFYNQSAKATDKNTLWQGSFYDEIIRNEEMLLEVRKYIYGNPSKWLEDDLFVE